MHFSYREGVIAGIAKDGGEGLRVRLGEGDAVAVPVAAVLFGPLTGKKPHAGGYAGGGGGVGIGEVVAACREIIKIGGVDMFISGDAHRVESHLIHAYHHEVGAGWT